MSEYKLLLKEELTKEDVKIIKELIANQLIKLFYTLYVKKNFWDK